MHPSFIGPSRGQWSGHKELELAKTVSGPASPPPVDREECVAELQIDLGSTSSQSGSVSPMSVPVVVREGGAMPHLQNDPEKDGDMMFHEDIRLDSPQFMKPLYVTESLTLPVNESIEDSQQPEKLTTSKAEAETTVDAYVPRRKDDALGPQISVLVEKDVTECAEFSFGDDEKEEEEEEEEEEGRDLEEDSDTDIDLEDSVEREEGSSNDREPPSSLPLHLESRLSPLGQHYLIDHPSEVEEVDFAAPRNKHKVCVHPMPGGGGEGLAVVLP